MVEFMNNSTTLRMKVNVVRNQRKINIGPRYLSISIMPIHAAQAID